MTMRNFNWNFTTAHRFGVSSVRESREPDKLIVDRRKSDVLSKQRRSERDQLRKDGKLENSYA